MKKVLVMSDSHGDYQNMLMAVERTSPDMILFLGDGWNDADKVKAAFPQIPMERVPGNGDYVREPEEKLISVEGFRIMMCHGHAYHVKNSFLTIQIAAQEKEARIVLFGHTHKLFYDWHNGLVMLNPGSIGGSGIFSTPSYGLLLLDGQKGTIDIETGYLTDTK